MQNLLPHSNESYFDIMPEQFMPVFFLVTHYKPIGQIVLVWNDMLLCSTTIQQCNAYR